MDRRFEDYHKKILIHSRLWLSYIYDTELDNSFGWGARMERLAEDFPKERYSGLLITGPDGCGKHTCAAHFLGALDCEETHVLRLTETELRVPKDADFGIDDYLNAELDEAYDSKKNMCLILELPEDVSGLEGLMDCLDRAACEYYVNRGDYPSLLLVIIKNSQKGLPTLLRSRMLECRMRIPSEAERYSFLKSEISELADGKINCDKLAKLTEGCVYSELLSIVQTAAERLAAGVISDTSGEALEELVLEVLGKTKSETRSETADSAKLYEKLCESFDRAAKAIEALAEKGPQYVAAQSAAAPTKETPAPVKSVEDIPIEDMDPYDLFSLNSTPEFLKKLDSMKQEISAAVPVDEAEE